MIELTTKQHQAIETTEGLVTFIDPETQQTYVLLRQETFSRLRGLFDADDARLMEHLLADLDPEDWVDSTAYEGNS